MSNILDNGTVLPSGLLGRQGAEAAVAAFNRSYRDTRLKAGIVVKSYAPTDPANINQLCTEYDVVTFEQYENKGSTSITYRNCISTQGFGSIADYFEYTLRPKTTQTNTGSITFKDQDGSVVLIECLDGIGEKAVVVGNLINPSRDTNITSNSPQMSGEYNGVNIEVANDGSCSLTFNGATDNQGNPTNSSLGQTTLQIKTDGSFQFNHSTVTIQANKSGVLNITTSSDTNITVGGNTNINTSGTANIISQGTATVDGSTIKLGENAIEAVIKGNAYRDIYNRHTHIGNLGLPVSPPLEIMDPSLSKHTFTE